MSTCEKCNSFGLNFKYPYHPTEFLMGKRNSKIWIVGLNPKEENDQQGNETIAKNKNYFDNSVHLYFRNFKKVSKVLHGLLGKEFGVAHTDLVKCPTKNFAKNNKNKMIKIIDNCRGYLRDQIKQYLPKIIICNGADVCKFIKEIIPPPTEYTTSYIGNLNNNNNNEVSVILSGFIGQIDDYAKIRLGIEIEFFMKKFGIM